ncbi:hypothetical protein [Aureispira anguillae]|uniref:Uncharacterized protein n=1 Tax=Aureispira anguillae TaxID=2864201 RepID=A0A916DRN4_9BACT|nr:hypothetical protein [Aureispira anguillae]BDS10512.1 hypothetical protein AsAng_0012200 [Aureispira anguillae]
MKLFFIGIFLLSTNFSFGTSILGGGMIASKAQLNLDSFPICSKFDKQVKIDTNLFTNKQNNNIDFVIAKNEYQLVGWIDLNKDNKADIVAHEPSAVGTSNEQFFTFFINCGNGYYAPTLVEYGRKFYIKKDLTNHFDCHHIILESWDIIGDAGEMSVNKHFYTYSFDGEQTFKRMFPELVFENKDLFMEEIPGDYISPISVNQNSIKVDFIRVQQEANRIDIELKNQKILSLESVKPNEIIEGKSHYKLIQYYKKIDHVLFQKQAWEAEEYVLISLEDGSLTRLKNRPIFSESQEKFCTIKNQEKGHTIDKKLALYSIKNKAITPPVIIDIKGSSGTSPRNRSRKFSIKLVDWIGESGLRCIQTIDNGMQDVEREATIWLKKDF